MLGEVDGYGRYGDDAWGAFRHEKRREDSLRAQGWSVVRWTVTQMLHEPHLAVARVRRALPVAPRPRSVGDLVASPRFHRLAMRQFRPPARLGLPGAHTPVSSPSTQKESGFIRDQNPAGRDRVRDPLFGDFPVAR